MNRLYYVVLAIKRKRPSRLASAYRYSQNLQFGADIQCKVEIISFLCCTSVGGHKYWWNLYAHRYSSSTAVARDILPVQATNLASERSFFIAGNLVEEDH